MGRREGREYKIGKKIRKTIQDWEGEKGEKRRLGSGGGETNCSARC